MGGSDGPPASAGATLKLSSSDAEYNTDSGEGGIRTEKDSKRRERKYKSKYERERSGVGGRYSGLKLAQHKVLAGQSRKTRDAKDPRENLASDMAAIFRVREDDYSLAPPSLPSHVNTNRRKTLISGEDNGGAVYKLKQRSRDKNRYGSDGSSGSAANKKKKSKRASE